MNRVLSILSFAGVGLSLVLISGCTKTEPPKPPPKRACITADECWEMKPSINKACGWSAETDGDVDGGRFGRVPGEIADRQFKLYGAHATKNVLVTLKTTVETQLPQPPQETHIPLLLRATPKGTEYGGRPDRVDRVGPDRFLGCEWVRSGDLIQRYRFEVVKACFEDDATCLAAPPYTKLDDRPPVDQELARCENACSGADPAKCFKYAEITGKPGSDLLGIHKEMIGKTVPFAINLTPLLATLGAAGTATCDPRNLEVSAANDAAAFGPACRLALSTPIGTPANLQSVVLDVPNVISGDFSRTGAGVQALAKIQFRLANSASLEFYNPGTSTMSVRDPLVSAYFAPTRLLLAGKSQFCAVVPYKGG